MSDPRWNHLPEELKTLGKKSPDTPTDPAAFKERVLREYERRTRWHLRARWLRRGVVAAGVCTAVLLGVLVAKPVLSPQEAPALKSAKQVQKQAALSSQDVAEQMEEWVYEAQVPNLPTQELSFFSSESSQEWLAKVNMPSGLRIDPAREVGFYLLNGSVKSWTLDSVVLQVVVSKNPAHVQVLRMPLEKLKASGLSGQQLIVSVYDESGTPIMGKTQVRVP